MATFKSRIEEYVGTTSDDTALSNWLTQGARFHVRLLPAGELYKHATIKTVDSSGYKVDDSIILSVDKDGYPSIKYPSEFKARLTDSESLYEATKQSPAHIIRGGRLYVFPGGGSAEVVEMPDISYNDSDIGALPSDLEDATVVLAAIQEVISDMSSDGSSSAEASLSGIDLTSEFSDVDTRLDDDDIELSRGRIEKINAMLKEYAAELNSNGQLIETLQNQYNNLISPYIQREG